MSAVDGRNWSVSRPGRFTTGETATSNHWMDSRANLEAMEKRKFLSFPGNDPRRPARSLSLHKHSSLALGFSKLVEE
jgi:hypothetical protein